MTETQKAPKVVWVISDGVPGHYNQSKGVLFALSQHYQLDVHWIELKLSKPFLRRPLAWLLNKSIPSLSKLSHFYQGDALAAQRPDVVIGAGGNSAYAIAWIGRAYQAKNIFCGSLRHLKAELFDAILVLEPDMPAPFISLKVSPVALDQTVLQQQAEQWRKEHPDVEHKLWSMLIGGDGAGAEYTDEDWINLAKQMNLVARQQGIKWLLSTSRRTGAAAEKLLQQYLNFEYIADVVWWSEVPRTVLHQFIAVSDRVYCGADSMSMMMESLTAMRPLVVYHPAKFQPDEKFSQVLHRLSSERYINVRYLTQLSHSDAEDLTLKALEYSPSLQLAQYFEDRLFS